MRYLLLLLFFALPACGQEHSTPPEVAETMAKIDAYESVEGIWEGKYTIENAPEELSKDTIGVRITLKNAQKPKVAFLFSEDRGWEETPANVDYIPDSLGWHILISGDGGVWQERMFISAARVEERRLEITVTRTVHNWYWEPDAGVERFYYVFGAGYLEKI